MLKAYVCKIEWGNPQHLGLHLVFTIMIRYTVQNDSRVRHIRRILADRYRTAQKKNGMMYIGYLFHLVFK